VIAFAFEGMKRLRCVNQPILDKTDIPVMELMGDVRTWSGSNIASTSFPWQHIPVTNAAIGSVCKAFCEQKMSAAFAAASV
jgi:hypothetical protein